MIFANSQVSKFTIVGLSSEFMLPSKAIEPELILSNVELEIAKGASSWCFSSIRVPLMVNSILVKFKFVKLSMKLISPEIPSVVIKVLVDGITQLRYWILFRIIDLCSTVFLGILLIE